MYVDQIVREQLLQSRKVARRPRLIRASSARSASSSETTPLHSAAMHGPIARKMVAAVKIANFKCFIILNPPLISEVSSAARSSDAYNSNPAKPALHISQRDRHRRRPTV